MNLFVAGLSYKTAPVEIREKLAVHPSRLSCSGCLLKLAGGLSEVVLLSTCNRVEIYGVGERLNRNLYGLFQTLASKANLDFTPYLYVKEGREAVEHLFAVASGLDSMVLGETEIAGQVKQAYQAAHEAKLTGRITNRLFQTALQTAKEIRTETAVGRGATSVGSVAVELAERIFKSLAEKTVLIIGAGKMGEACVRHLTKKGARSVLVSNRSHERALNLATEFGGRAIRFDECIKGLIEADIVVSSTGCPQTILNVNDLAKVMSARRHRTLFLIDIAVPRDIDPAVQQLENVYLYNVDHLETLVRENLQSRREELGRCMEIISERALALMAKIAPAPPKPFKPAGNASPEWTFGSLAVCAG
jgi:glutamyl-tRNA reductase